MTSIEETLENSDHICVNCRYRVGPLFIEYSDRNFRLTRCPRCHKIADKYIEYELFLPHHHPSSEEVAAHRSGSDLYPRKIDRVSEDYLPSLLWHHPPPRHRRKCR
eukprot:gene13374-14700_t